MGDHSLPKVAHSPHTHLNPIASIIRHQTIAEFQLGGSEEELLQDVEIEKVG